MQLFFAPNIKHELSLPQEEAIHCFKALRKNVGDEINVVDGNGNLYTCVISNNNPKSNALDIVDTNVAFHRRSNNLHLAIAPTKNMDRMEWLIEKATEIGIDEITLLKCDHSERSKVRTDRLYKKAVSAMKQSIKAYLPSISELTNFADFITGCSNKTKLIAHLRDDCKPIIEFSEHKDVCILIGPEGDFSSSEIDTAIKNGFNSVTLGTSRLRTETAGIVACALLNQH